MPPPCARTVRLLPSETVMPSSAVSVAPSQRIRFTLPVTVTRFMMVVFSVTAYQPSFQDVLFLLTKVTSFRVCVLPFSSR